MTEEADKYLFGKMESSGNFAISFLVTKLQSKLIQSSTVRETNRYVIMAEGLSLLIDARKGELRLQEEDGEKQACITFDGKIDPDGVSAKRYSKKNKLKISVPKA